MEHNLKQSLRDRLLSRQPESPELEKYRKEMTAMLERAEKRLRFEKWFVGSLWIFLVMTSVLMLLAGGKHIDTPKGTWFATMACIWLLYGAVELLKHFMNRYRVELLKEIKHVELQVRELRDAITHGAGPSEKP
jgi:hypothetical protein